jgi:hypothetical protein
LQVAKRDAGNERGRQLRRPLLLVLYDSVDFGLAILIANARLVEVTPTCFCRRQISLSTANLCHWSIEQPSIVIKAGMMIRA